MKNLVLSLLSVCMIIEIAIAKEKYIQLENNNYDMKNVCFNSQKVSDKEKSFYRLYKFTFKSKYNVFKNYSIADTINAPIFIETSLYTINKSIFVNYYERDRLIFALTDEDYKDTGPKILRNKKVMEILLDEEQMKKLYQSNSAKFIFHSSIFDEAYTKDKSNKYSNTLLKPVISISLNKNNFDYELEKCNQKYNTYSKKYDEYHSKPMNKIKTFFSF